MKTYVVLNGQATDVCCPINTDSNNNGSWAGACYGCRFDGDYGCTHPDVLPPEGCSGCGGVGRCACPNEDEDAWDEDA